MPNLNKKDYDKRLNELDSANRTGENIVFLTDTMLYKLETYLNDPKTNQASTQNLLDTFCKDILKGSFADYIKHNHAVLLRSVGLNVSSYSPFMSTGENVDIEEISRKIAKFHARVDSGLVISTLREFPKESKTVTHSTKKNISDMSNVELVYFSIDQLKSRLARRISDKREDLEGCLDFAFMIRKLASERIKTVEKIVKNPADIDKELQDKPLTENEQVKVPTFKQEG